MTYQLSCTTIHTCTSVALHLTDTDARSLFPFKWMLHMSTKDWLAFLFPVARPPAILLTLRDAVRVIHCASSDLVSCTRSQTMSHWKGNRKPKLSSQSLKGCCGVCMLATMILMPNDSDEADCLMVPSVSMVSLVFGEKIDLIVPGRCVDEAQIASWEVEESGGRWERRRAFIVLRPRRESDWHATASSRLR